MVVTRPGLVIPTCKGGGQKGMPDGSVPAHRINTRKGGREERLEPKLTPFL